MYALIRTVWFLSEMEFFARCGDRASPESLGLSFVHLDEGMKVVKGVLMVPEASDPPYLWRRLEMSSSVMALHASSAAKEGSLMRVEEGDEIVSNIMRTHFESVTGLKDCKFDQHFSFGSLVEIASNY